MREYVFAYDTLIHLGYEASQLDTMTDAEVIELWMNKIEELILILTLSNKNK